MEKSIKKVAISCGPIPARLDAVKFVTNRFKGGLAFKTAARLISQGFDVTIVKWVYTELPRWLQQGEYSGENTKIISVTDVFAYYDWFKEHAKDYDAFIMAAAVANLAPSHSITGKFPSHNYAVGERFNIEFEIAPRAIDVIKKENPYCCLIGYKLFDADDEELVRIAKRTLSESKANIIFANTPAKAKDRKLAVMADGTVLPCSFEDHLQLMCDAIHADYFRTEVKPLTEEEKSDASIKRALATVKMFDSTFPGYGTVAVPVKIMSHQFATTSRGHQGEPVLIREIDFKNRIIYASGKATLNAPTLAAALDSSKWDSIIVHRHFDDPLFQKDLPYDEICTQYLFPGSLQEAEKIRFLFAKKMGNFRVKLHGHGDLRRIQIQDVDWNRYYELFPERYFGVPEKMEEIIRQYDGKETLEIGCNRKSCAKYAYDPFVQAENAINLDWQEVMNKHFDLVIAKNCINYMSKEEMAQLIKNTDHFVANTFLKAPEEKVVPGIEASITNHLSDKVSIVEHTLRLPDDTIMRHAFFARTEEDYLELGFHVEKYGRNSALLTI